MARLNLTPFTATALLILFAIAVGTFVMNMSEAEVSEEAPTATQATLCEPMQALKMKFINNEINEQEYQRLKAILEEDDVTRN